MGLSSSNIEQVPILTIKFGNFYRTVVIGNEPKNFHPQRSDGLHRLDQDPPPHPPHGANRDGTRPPRIPEKEPAPNLQTPIQRRRPRWTPIHARFTWYSIGVQYSIVMFPSP